MKEEPSVSGNRQMSWRGLVDLIATIAVAIASVLTIALAWHGLRTQSVSAREPQIVSAGRGGGTVQRSEPPLPAQPLSMDGAQVRGAKTATIGVIEFSDFQCPYCGRFAHEVLPVLERDYISTGKVLIAFRNLPLSIHPFALGAAVAAECAGEQGKFWAMHDALFADQKSLDIDSVAKRARRENLDAHQYENCVAAHAGDRVERDMIAAKTLQVNGTPTFFIGQIDADGRVKVQKRFSGTLPVGDFTSIVDSLIVAANPSVGSR
jgi:protein-disulfide isomerase